MERLGLLLHRASDGRLAPHFGAGPFSWPLLENPQSCDQGHTTARRRAVSGGLGELSPPRAEALCGRRHAWGVPLFTLHFSPDFFSCVAVFAGGLIGWLPPQQQLRQLGDVGGDAPGSNPP
jgi:hypothetical protein